MDPNSPAFTERLNLFHYRRHLRKLGPTDIQTARNWCLSVIRREHPKWTDEEVERFYDSLIHVELVAVDEWTRRMT